MLFYENLTDLIVSFSILELCFSKNLIPPIKLDTCLCIPAYFHHISIAVYFGIII